MDETLMREVMREMGRKGGRARAARMTPEERAQAASRAGRAPRPAARRKITPETDDAATP